MQLKSLVAASVLTGLCALAQAAVTVNAGSYTLTFDETTPGFGSISGLNPGVGSVSFEWSIQPIVQVISFGGAPAVASFAIPDFTITANPGYVLSGPVTRRIGNLAYSQTGAGEVVSVEATGAVAIDGTSLGVPPVFSLPQVTSGPNLGYFDGTASFPAGSFNSLAVTAASLTLRASGGAFATIFAQPQNVLKIEFTVSPVPEPQTYALFLAGFGMIGWLARRRHPR